MKQFNGIYVLCVSALLLLPVGGQADVYHWVDDKGRVHYGDESPEGTVARKIDMPVVKANARQVPPSDIGNAERRQRQKRIAETLSFERKSREDALQKKQDKKAEKKAKCERLRIGLAESKSVNVYYRRNEEGERVFISDKERKNIDAVAEKKYQKKCSR
ncbi:MAG: DUF4124 domain-containing protein [Pseudomonadales bacterium]|nr:DUF4124 domain-containing protein [Pseudomonadales bacterium]